MAETLQAENLYLRDIKHPVISREKLSELIAMAQAPTNGAMEMQSRSDIVANNQRLVRSIAAQYCKPNRHLSLMDLVQEGNIGLLKAIEKFEDFRGIAFSTYATWWIRQAILGAISDQSREVRIPRYLVEKIVKVNKVERELKALLNRDPSEEEIAIEAEITLGKLKQIRAIAFRFLNLDQPINGNDPESRILGEVLPNEEWEKEFTQAAARSDLRELFAEQVIDEREANILKERFLSPEEPTLTDLSEQLGISRERVRQIERRALNRLRVCDPTL